MDIRDDFLHIHLVIRGDFLHVRLIIRGDFLHLTLTNLEIRSTIDVERNRGEEC